MLTAVPSKRWFAIAAGLAVIALIGLRVPAARDALLLLDAMWVLAALVDALLAVPPRAIAVERTPPPAFSVGRALPVEYRWSAPRHRRATMRVREEWPEPLGGLDRVPRVVRIEAGRHTIERLMMRPVHRGVGDGGGITLRVLGPLGLAWRQARIERPWTATVFPSLAGVAPRSLVGPTARRREAGLRNVRYRGEGRLFEGLREWVPGDDTRSIDWKATGRRGKPIARQYEDERRQQVLLVVDAGRLLTAEIDGVSRLESVVTAVLRLAHTAVEHDDNVGIMVFADEVLHFVPPSRGRRALRGVVETLAAVEGRLVESNYPAAFQYLAMRNRKRALTVLFTDVIDRSASAALVAQTATLRPRHLPLAVTLRDPALERVATARAVTVQGAYERAAAEELLLARAEALADMRSRGVLVLDVPPESATEAIVQRYEQLKRRGLL